MSSKYSTLGLHYLNSLGAWNGYIDYLKQDAKRVLEYLGNPQDKVKTIHIAGTNGKGSCAVTISSIISSAGFKVGMTTSPHLMRHNERIVIDGVQIEDERLGNLAYSLSQTVKHLNCNLSYFEAITIIAFVAFELENVDWAVIEVGLGGRLDTTNLINKPEATIITSIGLDHQEILGDSIAKIAAEKAGIIKTGCDLVVVGDLSKEGLGAIEEISNNLNLKVSAYGREFNVVRSNQIEAQYLDNQTKETINFQPGIQGEHQHSNIGVAIYSARKLGFSALSCIEGSRNANWPGRLEKIEYGNRNFLLDAAHNLDGIKSLINYLDSNCLISLDICFGALQDKPWKEMLDHLKPYANSFTLFEPDSPRAVNTEQISNYLSGFDISINSFSNNYLTGINSLLKKSGPLVLVTGSIYFIGTIRKIISGDKWPNLFKK